MSPPGWSGECLPLGRCHVCLVPERNIKQNDCCCVCSLTFGGQQMRNLRCEQEPLTGCLNRGLVVEVHTLRTHTRNCIANVRSDLGRARSMGSHCRRMVGIGRDSKWLRRIISGPRSLGSGSTGSCEATRSNDSAVRGMDNTAVSRNSTTGTSNIAKASNSAGS